MRITTVVAIGLVVAATSWFACGEKSDKAEEKAAEDGGTADADGGDDGEVAIQPGQIALTGTIAASAALQDGAKVTHVIAFDTDSNESHVVEVDADGKFTLPLEKEAAFVLTYVDTSKTGEEMLISTFGSGELNSIATSDAATNIDLGAVDVAAATASSATGAEALVTAMGLSAASAETWGKIDDSSLRYSNPDIDGDGKVDAANNQKFPLDFHNRFSVVTKDGGNMAMKDLKNAFPPDDADVKFEGSGIIPWFEDSVYSTPLDKYTWKFSTDVVLGNNGGVSCDGMTGGDTLVANTECNMTATDGGPTGKRPSIELSAAVAGKYTLVAGGKTFTWPNVKVSDFSGGKDFLALFIRMDVNESDKLTGVSYRWRIKNEDGTWRAATNEEIKLVISGGKGYISLKVDGMNSGKELGVSVPAESEGSIAFASAVYATSGGGDSSDANVNLPESGLTEAEVKAGVDWTRVLENPGISYDDKLGMRFFMGFNGPNN